MKTVTIAAVMATVFGFVSAVQASTIITQTKSYSGSPTFSTPLTFDEFDDAGGTLTLLRVTITLDATVADGKLVVDNDGEAVANTTVEFGATIELDSSDVSIAPGVDVTSTTSGSLSLSADNGDTTTFDSDTSQPDVDEIAGASNSASSSKDQSNLSDFIGTSQYDIEVDAIQTFDLGTIGGAQTQIDPLTASGDVTVVYEYIPEPASAALLGLSGVALLARRRR